MCVTLERQIDVLGHVGQALPTTGMIYFFTHFVTKLIHNTVRHVSSNQSEQSANQNHGKVLLQDFLKHCNKVF